MTTLLGYMDRLSGKDFKGDDKSQIIYQSFALEDEEDSDRKKTLYSITKAGVRLSLSKMTPQFIKLDIEFNSCDDAELKLFWSRLRQIDKFTVKEPEKTWVFHVQLTEVASVVNNSEEGILEGHFCNPIMSYITRSTPSNLSSEFNVNGERLGGNIITMLFAAETTQFELVTGLDLEKIKSDAEIESIGELYLNTEGDQTGFEDF